MSSKGMGAVPRADPLQLFKIIPHFIVILVFIYLFVFRLATVLL